MFLPKWVIVGGLVLALAEAFSENAVYLKSPEGYINKLVTSSTLKWISAWKGGHPETTVVGTVERYINESAKVNPFKPGEEESDGIVERNVYICRASHSGLWIPGQLRLGRKVCLVSLHDNIHSYEKYEVLDNGEGGARLTWTRWDKYNDVPSGAVSSGDSFIARRPVKTEEDKSLGMKHLIGKLDDSNGYGKLNVITQDEKEEEVEDGQVLIEIEPIRYELTNIKFNLEKRVVNKSPLSLGDAVLSNNQNFSGRIDTMIGYDDNTTMYWGQVKAMLKGLPTIIRGSTTSDTNFPYEIEWGIPVREFTKRLKTVEAFLEPETAVNVTLKGNHTEIETPYTAKLIAVYSDGANRARNIHGTRSEVKLLDVTPDFSPVYFTGNYSLVPTTTTTSTTTTTTTTTTAKATTTHTTTESSTNNIITKNGNTVEGKEDDVTNKINVMDDQSPSNKAASTQHSGSTISKIETILLFYSTFTLLYRIL